MTTYFTVMIVTLLVQLLCLMVKDLSLKKNLSLLIVVLATATAFFGLAAGSWFAPMWFIVAIIYIMSYRQLRNL